MNAAVGERRFEPDPFSPVPRVARLVGVEADGTLRVDLGEGPLSARTTLSLGREAAEAAAAEKRSVLVLFENGDPALPIVIGFVQEGPAALRLAEREAPRTVEAKVDGRRVVLEAEDELELKCGEASVILRRNGRVLVRGAYVETRAKGVNRIKGGSVSIN